jgi:hypothetical protein
MKIKLVTSYKPGTWTQYAEKSVKSVLENWPDIAVNVYHEGPSEETKMFHPRLKWIDLHTVQPNLVKFKNKYKDDPVANGELQEIPGGVRRPKELQTIGGSDKNKGSYLWAAVRFANKVFCVTHAIKTSVEKEYDYVVWLDADTYTFRPMPREFLENLLPKDTMLTYLGRENPKLNDGGKYPECGFVGYNLRHPEIQNFAREWEEIYNTDHIFKLLEWHDSYVLWHLSKIYRKEKNIKVHDIGYWKGVKGHHVFVNSELGLYIDHMKGKRKQIGSSAKNDFRPQQLDTTKDISQLEYWSKVPPTLK